MSVPILYAGSRYKPGKLVPIPAPPAPVAPHFASAEVGNVNASTVAVTFDTNIIADGSNYSSGVTIKVNGSTRSFESGIRQANHAIVNYALASPVLAGDTVTWEYSAAAGHIVSESNGLPLADVTAQTVTNNVADAIGDALRALPGSYWTFNESAPPYADSKLRFNLDQALTDNPIQSVAGVIGNAAKSIDDTNNGNNLVGNGSTLDISSGFFLWGWLYVPQFDKSNIGSFELFKGRQNPSPTKVSLIVDLYQVGQDGMEFFAWGGGENPPLVIQAGWHFFVLWVDAATPTQYQLQVDNGSVSVGVIGVGESPASINHVELIEASYTNNIDYVILDECGLAAGVYSADYGTYLYNSGAGKALYP